MNIKNERVHDLAKQAARLTGLSQTSAVEEGLRLLLAEHGQDDASERQRKRDSIRAISLAWCPDPTRVPRLAEHEDLYQSKTGLPA